MNQVIEVSPLLARWLKGESLPKDEEIKAWAEYEIVLRRPGAFAAVAFLLELEQIDHQAPLLDESPIAWARKLAQPVNEVLDEMDDAICSDARILTVGVVLELPFVFGLEIACRFPLLCT